MGYRNQSRCGLVMDGHYRLVCKGLRPDELQAIYRELADGYRGRPAFRNPFPPEFDARTVHEILVGAGIILAYPAKKAVDVLTDIIKQKLVERDSRKKNIKIYRPDGSMAIDIMYVPDKPKR